MHVFTELELRRAAHVLLCVFVVQSFNTRNRYSRMFVSHIRRQSTVINALNTSIVEVVNLALHLHVDVIVDM